MLSHWCVHWSDIIMFCFKASVNFKRRTFTTEVTLHCLVFLTAYPLFIYLKPACTSSRTFSQQKCCALCNSDFRRVFYLHLIDMLCFQGEPVTRFLRR